MVTVLRKQFFNTDCGSALAKFNSKDVEERIVREMEKISGISSEILNSVEDLKQLTR
jgi:hypothetical protein